MPPAMRVLGFATGITAITFLHFQRIVDYNMCAQLVLYASGGISFLRYIVALILGRTFDLIDLAAKLMKLW